MSLISEIIQGDLINIAVMLLSYAVVILLLIPIHEFSHAYTAYKLGDNSQKWLGRLTLNPFKHNDLKGILFFVIAGFGWGRPVMVNSNNFNMKNKRLGMAITAAAGPVSNILFAFVIIIIERACEILLRSTGSSAVYNICLLLIMIAQLSISLAIFNLIPIAPLDGSKIFGLFFPEKVLDFCERYSIYLLIGLIALIRFTFFGDLISMASTGVYSGLHFVIDKLFLLFGV